MKRSWILFMLFAFVLSNLAVAQKVAGLSPSGDKSPRAEKGVQNAKTSPSRHQKPGQAPEWTPPSMGNASPSRHLWGDIDRDGLKDLFVLDPEGNLLFSNLGDGGFRDVTALAFPDGAMKGVTGFFGDYDSDELLDLFLFHSEGFTLFRNEGKLRFSDVTRSLGLDPSLRSGNAHLEDYDGDGCRDLLVQTPEGDRIYRNNNGRDFGTVNLQGPQKGSRGAGPLQPVSSPGGKGSPGLGASGNPTTDAIYVNDNSPGSVGIGIPEVEGGADDIVMNDILDDTITSEDVQDGSLTGIDILNGSIDGMKITPASLEGDHIVDQSLTGADIAMYTIPPDRVFGTAATLTGDQNFGPGMLFIDMTNHRVGIGTTAPSYRLDVLNPVGTAIQGRAAGTTGLDFGVMGITDSTTDFASGVYGASSATSGRTFGLYGLVDSSGTFATGVCGTATATSGNTIGVYGDVSSPDGMAVFGNVHGTTGYSTAVYGQNESTEGNGVYGYATATSGKTYGVHGESNSSNGYGVYGASAGQGVHGRSHAADGIGVYGWTYDSSGFTYGVYGRSESSNGKGILGFGTYGVHGESTSSIGRGVAGAGFEGVYGYSPLADGTGVAAESKYGKAVDALTTKDSTNAWAPAIYGRNEGAGDGMYGWSQNRDGTVGVTYSATGSGVYGIAVDASGQTNGVYGKSDSSSGAGVRGEGGGYGVYGETSATSGMGVVGTNSATTGYGYGVFGGSDSNFGTGVYGIVTHTNGFVYGVYGETWAPSGKGYGVYSFGDFGCSGTKSFVQPHPIDASKEIRFVCLEGNESGTYFRGSSRLESGEAFIDVPEDFRLVTEADGITVQVTPMGPGRIWVEEYGLDGIVVRGDADLEFHYFVNGLRRGFAEFETMHENRSWRPKVRGKPFGTQFPDDLRRILVDNGTLNPDFTPNEAMAKKLGWELEEPETDSPKLASRTRDEKAMETYLEAQRERKAKEMKPLFTAKERRKLNTAAPERKPIPEISVQASKRKTMDRSQEGEPQGARPDGPTEVKPLENKETIDQ